MSDATLTIPGHIFIGAEVPGKGAAIVQLGPAAGWTIPRGINSWSRELSVVLKQDLTPELLKQLGVLLPEQQGDPELVPKARLAAQACKVVSVEEPLVDQLLAKGVRVHTVGFDRVSNGFFYFAKGGGGKDRRVQGELIEIISPTLETGTREELDARLDGLIDRLIAELSEGALSEAQLELADALPPLAPKSDKVAVKLQTLEGWLILASTRSAKFDTEGRKLAEALRGATRRETDVVKVEPFGEARRVAQAELEVEVVDGDAGQRGRLTLPARTRWFIAGGATPSTRPPAPSAVIPESAAKPEVARPAAARPAVAAQPSASGASGRALDKSAAERAASDKAARDRAAAEKAAADKAAANKAAADKAAADKAAADKAAADKAAADKAARDKAAAERAAAERVAAERAAAEKAVAERAAAERAAADRAAAERAAAQVAATERAAEERAAAERAAAEKAAAERAAAAERSAADARSAQRDNADRVAMRRSVPDGTATTKPGVGPKAARKARDARTVDAQTKESFPFAFILLMLVVGAVIGAALRFVRR